MSNNKKVYIGKYEYSIMEDEERKKYLYRYDVEYGVGIKLKFSDELEENIRDLLKNMLMKQYIDRIIKDL